ncbi:hypothetical protein BDV95DRAFT_119474 [Massariosphaeria phaeospora]|uniref:Uncharacterized protein n=1 Tax=Massariosphaeria phaeospora TaxID=100035 RepID=A0A7C8I1X4_9PLEO|nr:hypothetical protein BDV95DRAFT_119474 [Massariosphaeria phaeospora]
MRSADLQLSSYSSRNSVRLCQNASRHQGLNVSSGDVVQRTDSTLDWSYSAVRVCYSRMPLRPHSYHSVPMYTGTRTLLATAVFKPKPCILYRNSLPERPRVSPRHCDSPLAHFGFPSCLSCHARCLPPFLMRRCCVTPAARVIPRFPSPYQWFSTTAPCC